MKNDNHIKKLAPGLFLTIILAYMSFWVSQYIPIGAVTIGIVLGIVIGNLFRLSPAFLTGISFSEKKILSWAIVLMGIKLNFNVLQELGWKSIIIIILSISFTIFSAILLSKIFKLKPKLGLLLGIGNGICGSSAIAATEGIIGADKEDIGLSVAIVNFLGTIGIFLLPFIAKILMHFSDVNAGFIIGDTLQAVGQVIAAGFSINDNVGHTATIVKMMRILMLTPVVLILIGVFNKQKKVQSISNKQKKVFPYFIIGFILMSFIPSFQLLPESNINIIAKISHYLLIIAMVGIGLKVHFSGILKNGQKALGVASLVFLLQIIFGILLIELFL